MHDRRPHLLALTVAVSAAVGLTNCGPAKPTPQPAPGPTAAPEPTGDAPEPQPTGEGGTAQPQPTTPAPGPGVAKVTAVPMGASKMLADVEKIGVDMKKPIEIGKIPLGQKKKLMPLFQKALGFDACTDCHASETDFKTETKNLLIARHMWNEYVVKLRETGNKPLFCDSCHQGHEHMIPRHDKDAVQAFMKAEYEAKLERADGEEHSCSTCHGDAFETAIFAKLWNIDMKK
jgi:hypothetical protein